MSDERMTKLVDLALDVFEDEVRCWRRLGTHQPQVTRLVRYPKMPDLKIDDAGIGTFDDADTVEYFDVPDKQVNDLLRRIAMDKVIKAITKEILI
jgi:hypothetical protein